MLPSTVRDLVQQGGDPNASLADLCVLGAASSVFGIYAPRIFGRLRRHPIGFTLVVGSLVQAVATSTYLYLYAMLPEALEHLPLPIDRWILTTQIGCCVGIGVAQGIDWLQVRALLRAEEEALQQIALDRLQEGFLQPEVLGAALNDTHMTSVHRASSGSALRLHDSYGADIADRETPEQLLAPMRQWIEQDPNFRAYRGPASYLLSELVLRDVRRDARTVYIDPVSGKTVTQLIALIFEAMKDRPRCRASLEDAGRAFIQEGLFQMVGSAGYICQPGVFNKAVEAMVGILPDCASGGVSPLLAALKCQSLVREKTKEYLDQQRLSSADPVFAALLDSCRVEGVAAIWGAIASPVRNALLEEYAAPHDIVSPAQLEAILEHSTDVDIADLLTSDVPAPLVFRAAGAQQATGVVGDVAREMASQGVLTQRVGHQRRYSA